MNVESVNKHYILFVLSDMHFICRASIMCRNLGFEYGEVIDRDGSNTGLDIVLDNVDCNGDE